MPVKMSSRDQCVNQKVIRQLLSHGVRSPCEVVVSTCEGLTTLSGGIEHEHQRRTAVRAAQTTAGVRSVVDRLQVISKNSRGKQRGFSAPYLQI